MENFFSRLTLDIIGKAVFNYDFDSLTHDDPVIKVFIKMHLPCIKPVGDMEWWQHHCMMPSMSSTDA